jgi:membrane protease YdiL (CAAX protease family)
MAHLLSGMVMGILLYGITFLISLSTGAEEVIGKPNYRASILPFLLFIFGNFLSSFSEDILTRGYIFKHLKDRANPLVILFISAAVYLLNHIHRLNSSGETRLFLFVLGVLFVVPLIVTKRLWFTGGMHWAGNCVFYFTHSVIKTQDGENPFTANFILVLCSLVFLLLNYGVLKWLQTKWAIDE